MIASSSFFFYLQVTNLLCLTAKCTFFFLGFVFGVSQVRKPMKKTIVEIMEIDLFTKFFHVPVGVLAEEWNVQVPPFQRTYITDRVEKFENVLVNVFEEFGTVLSLGVITLGKLRTTSDYYILDGQHRFRAYKSFAEKYDLDEHNDFKIATMVRDFDGMNDMKQYFCLLNDHFAPPDFVREVESLDRSEILKNHFVATYASFFSTRTRTRFPCVLLDPFVTFVLARLSEIPDDKLISVFQEQNASIGEAMACTGENEKHATLEKKGGLFFVFAYTRATAKTRANFPQSVRRDVWKRRYPLSIDGSCVVCACDVDIHDFHVGHKTAQAMGGTDTIDNLDVVCASCNYSMGVMSLHDFKSKYYTPS
jgi:hypothetical protein